MRPEDIREMFDRERPASFAEAVRSMGEVRSDPRYARIMLEVLFAMAPEHEAIAWLLRTWLESMLLSMIRGQAAADDEFALQAAGLLLDIMDKSMEQPEQPTKTPRGRARRPKAA